LRDIDSVGVENGRFPLTKPSAVSALLCDCTVSVSYWHFLSYVRLDRLISLVYFQSFEAYRHL